MSKAIKTLRPKELPKCISDTEADRVIETYKDRPCAFCGERMHRHNIIVAEFTGRNKRRQIQIVHLRHGQLPNVKVVNRVLSEEQLGKLLAPGKVLPPIIPEEPVVRSRKAILV